MLTFAAGLAAGYVLGTRAGRERFEQLVRGVRKVGDHPTVVQAQDKVKDVLSGNTERQEPSVSTTMPTTTSSMGATASSGASRPLTQ